MKKAVLLAMVFMFICGLAFGQGDTHQKYVYEFRVVNDAPIGKTYIIGTDVIRPKIDKLVGYRVIPITSGATETCCGLYDGTDYLLFGECFGESEAANGGSEGELWLIPKEIKEGVVVQQGAFTVVIVYFVRE